jgi:hypothetical protein
MEESVDLPPDLAPEVEERDVEWADRQFLSDETETALSTYVAELVRQFHRRKLLSGLAQAQFVNYERITIQDCGLYELFTCAMENHEWSTFNKLLVLAHEHFEQTEEGSRHFFESMFCYAYKKNPLAVLFGKQNIFVSPNIFFSQDIFVSLMKDDREPCWGLAVLLGGMLNNWEFVIGQLNSDKCCVEKLYCAWNIVENAFCKEAWDVASLLLKRLIEQRDNVSVKEALDDFDHRRVLFQGFAIREQNPMFFPGRVKKFVRWCLLKHLDDVAALFALWARLWGVVGKLVKRLDPERDDYVLLLIIQTAASEKERGSRVLYNFLLHHQGQQLPPSIVDEIVLRVCRHCYSIPSAVSVVKSVMGQCRNRAVLSQFLSHMIIDFDAGDLMRTFCAKGLMRYVDKSRVCKALHVSLCLDFQEEEDESYLLASSDYPFLLRCFELGLCLLLPREPSTIDSSTNCLHVAVHEGKLPVVRLFYNTGVLTEAAAYDLLRQMGREKWKKPRYNTAQVMEFLEEVSSTPRTLTSLCCVAVSDALGCHDRKTRALSLGLPLALTRQVLFLDVLYPQDS